MPASMLSPALLTIRARVEDTYYLSIFSLFFKNKLSEHPQFYLFTRLSNRNLNDQIYTTFFFIISDLFRTFALAFEACREMPNFALRPNKN